MARYAAAQKEFVPAGAEVGDWTLTPPSGAAITMRDVSIEREVVERVDRTSGAAMRRYGARLTITGTQHLPALINDSQSMG